MAEQGEEIDPFEQTFRTYGKELTGGTDREAQELFICQFGTSPLVCCHLWHLINTNREGNLPHGACPKKLLWATMFLKTYDKESTRKKTCNADKKTIRKWVWYFVCQIADLAQYIVSRINFIL
jgi:hypothetical protein